MRAQFDANRARRKKAVTVSELNPKSWTPTFGFFSWRDIPSSSSYR
ncbi:hypothetical protein BURCENK562V_C6215 [Burkholderia cenocepacia K56-2Valvano]|nr:hypothetical protein BURCENK562V_C6215 [Burkholderia cenocepacia K56-2Valvano]